MGGRQNIDGMIANYSRAAKKREEMSREELRDLRVPQTAHAVAPAITAFLMMTPSFPPDRPVAIVAPPAAAMDPAAGADQDVDEAASDEDHRRACRKALGQVKLEGTTLYLANPAARVAGGP